MTGNDNAESLAQSHSSHDPLRRSAYNKPHSWWPPVPFATSELPQNGYIYLNLALSGTVVFPPTEACPGFIIILPPIAPVAGVVMLGTRTVAPGVVFATPLACWASAGPHNKARKTAVGTMQVFIFFSARSVDGYRCVILVGRDTHINPCAPALGI